MGVDRRWSHAVRLVVFVVALLWAASPALAQPFAYVLGQRDDPPGGDNRGPSTVSVINTATNAIVQTIPVGVSCLCVNPDSAVISQDGRRVYVANEVAQTVSVIDTAMNTVAGTINVGASLSAIAVSPDGETLYVVAQPAQVSLYAFSTSTGILEATLPLSVTQARGIAVTPDGSRAYVSTYGSNSVKAVDLASFAVITTITVGSLPVGVDITPDGAFVYVANFSSDSVSVISTASNTVVATVPMPAGTRPQSARLIPDGSRAFVANAIGNSVSVINTATNTVSGSPIAVMFNPRTLEFTPDGSRAYVANSQNVQVINTATLAVAPTISFSTATHGAPAALAMTPASTTNPIMRRDKPWLRFGAVRNGTGFASQTAEQVVRLTQTGAGTVNWTATATQPWLQVSPAMGTGSATLTVTVVATAGLPTTGTVQAAIRFTFSGATPNTGQLPVILVIIQAGASTSPTGVVDTPAPNATGITGAIPVTGWALDDIEVDRVMICRAAFGAEVAPVDPNCAGAAQIFVGFGVFIDGARPDVQAAFPTRPRSSRAGWGFMLLTNMLPSQGNGTYQFFIYAQDREGRTTVLGTRTITCANASATKPFGAIDTPTQGGVASGASFVNFGWALTQAGKFIPMDGSTITVLIDGAGVGTVSYNHFRSDIATLFPGLANSNGAIGFRILDTTLLTTGLHTISWIVTDNTGAIEGIGSRFFSVSNGVGSITAAARRGGDDRSAYVGIDVTDAVGDGASAPRDEAPLLGRRGWDLAAPWRQYGVASTGRSVIRGEEIDRFELWLGPRRGERYTGYMRVGRSFAPLPLGSRLDAQSGWFTWAPVAGFVGNYDLVFVRWAGNRPIARHDVRLILAPKGRGHVGTQVEIDSPRHGQDVAQPFVVTGWAADLGADGGTGIDTLHAWAYPVGGGPPIFVGTPELGGIRPDVAAVHGEQFMTAGFALTVGALASGTYDLAVFPWSNVTGGFAPPKIVRVHVR
jgi:YVTN family beta-propeller protein